MIGAHWQPNWKSGSLATCLRLTRPSRSYFYELSRLPFRATTPGQLLRSFCALTRAFFQASGAYFWSRSADGELVGAEADADDPRVFSRPETAPRRCLACDGRGAEAARLFSSTHLDAAPLSMARIECHAHAALAAPLLVSGEVVGAITFLRSVAAAGFDDDAMWPKSRSSPPSSAPRSRRFA